MGLNLVPVDIPGGLNSDDTTYSAPPSWADGSNVRFRLGRPQVIGGWESLTLSLLSGVCRTVFAWTENNTNALDVAFGEHDALEVWQAGALYDITPTLGLPPHTLGASPFATTNGSPTVTVTDAGHGMTTGASVTITGAVDTNGILAAALNGTRTITVTGDNAYTFTAGSNATSTASGGGSAVVIAPQVAFVGGAIDGSGSAGYGTGAYGGGAYGAPSTTDFFAMTWSLAAWGQRLIANPRNQTLHLWSNATGTPAAPISNAPRQCTYALVSPQRQVFALGCTQENGLYNPSCIRHSSVGDETQWATLATSSSTAREYVLPGGGRIVAGRVAGRYLLVWTNHALWLGTYIGQISEVWRFDKVGDRCGLIGPNAAVVLGSTAYWISPDRQFHAYTLGGAVQALPCPIRGDFAENLAFSQADKIVASSIAEFGEVRWDYPDGRDGFENSRYVALCVEGPDAGAWYRGQLARTAVVDAGPQSYPIGVTYGGAVYWHEKGDSADGGALSWSLTSTAIYMDENFSMLARKLFPDTGGQLGAISLTISTFMAPNDASPRTFGPYTIPAGQQEIDILAEGRLFQFAFSGSSTPAFMRLGKLLFDAKARGRR